MGPCEAVTLLHSCHSSVNHDLTRSITFICDYGKQQCTLDEMLKVVKCLIEIHQEILSECKEEYRHAELFRLVYDYYRIIHGAFELYNDFIRLLKDASDSWLSVKMALEQILAKSRTNKDYSYREMLEQLNDLEVVDGIRFCDNFITSFELICTQAVNFSKYLKAPIRYIGELKPMITLEKVSSIIITCLFSILAVYVCPDELLQEMKGASSYSMCSVLTRSWRYQSSLGTRNYGKELRIWDFFGSAVAVQELKTKMARFVSFTHENEEEMMIVINKLEKMTDNISMTIDDMCRLAHIFSLDIREVGITLNQFIVDDNIRFSVFETVISPPYTTQQFANPVSEARSILCQTTLSLTLKDLQWYIRACEEEADNSSLLSSHSIIHYNTSSIIRIICDLSPMGGGKFVDDIHKAITCLHAINRETFKVLSECKEEWRHHPQLFDLVYEYHNICSQTYQLYNDFVKLLKGQCDSGLSVILAMKEFVVNWRLDDDYPNDEEEMMSHLNYDKCFTLSGDFMKSFAYICRQTVAFTRHFNEEIQELKSTKVLAKVSSGLITGIFSVMAAYMIHFESFPWMKEKTLTCQSLYLKQRFSWGNRLWNGKWLVINEFSDIYSCLVQVKYLRLSVSVSAWNDAKERMMIVIDTLEKKISKMSVTFGDMSRHAHECSHDIIKAGITLELMSHTHMLPINRKHTPENVH